MMRNIILGTDWWTDCDDVAALRIACRAAQKGIWSLRGIVVNACMPLSIASINAFLTAEGFGDLPLGIDRKATDFGGSPVYQQALAKLPHTVRDDDDVPDGLDLYLHLLREADDRVELIEIGYPQVLAALCAHEEGGRYLKEKVKCIWMMAGNWQADGHGKENNFARNARSREAAAYLLKHCPCPIIFLGWEVGADVICGGPEMIHDNQDPLRQAFIAHGSIAGRSSWDPMLVLLSCMGNPAQAGYTLRRGYASVDAITGENDFAPDPNGHHAYVIKQQPDTWYQKQLAHWIQP